MSGRKISISPFAAAIVSGALLFSAFPPFSAGWIGWFAMVPLLSSIQRAKSRGDSFLYGFTAGFIFFIAGFSGLFYVTAIGWILLAAAEALFLGLFAWIVFESAKPLMWPLRVLWTALIWLCVEFFRAKAPWFQLGWNLLGYSQSQYPLLIQSANAFGVFGLSFGMAIGNSLIYEAFSGTLILARSSNKSFKMFMTALSPFIFFFVLLALIFSHGIYHLGRPGNKIADLRVSVIQGNIPQSVKWELVARDKILEIYSGLTELAAYDDPSLIIWPEAAFPGYFNHDPAAEDIRNLVRKISIPTLVGTTLLENDDTAYNSAVLVGADGEDKARYDKLFLVPFGEYMPMKWALGWLTPFAYSLGVSDFTAGREKTVFHILNGEVSFAALICFEDTFPDLARDFIKRGAQFLTVITNDAWFHESGAAAQHLQASIFRAVENGVPVVRAANTGISAFIDNRGRVLGRVENEKGKALFVTGRKTLSLPVQTKETIFLKGGWVFPYAASGLFVIIIAVSQIKKALNWFYRKAQRGKAL